MYSSSRFINIRGCSIHYRIMRPEGAIRHRALLIASPGLSTYNWRYLVPELQEAGTLCVLCDLPGFGLSSTGEHIPFRQDLRARYLWGLLDSVDAQYGGGLATWNLMAHGSACGTIVEMALAHPDSVSSLFMVSPLIYPLFPQAVRPLLRSPLGRAVTSLWFKRTVVSRSAFSRWISKLYGRKLPVNLVSQLRGPMLRLNQPEGTLQQLLLDGHSVDGNQLRKLFMPIMILWGGRDHLLGGEIPARLRRNFPEAEFHLFPASGHCSAETNHRAVCDFLRGWIREMWP